MCYIRITNVKSKKRCEITEMVELGFGLWTDGKAWTGGPSPQNRLDRKTFILKINNIEIKN